MIFWQVALEVTVVALEVDAGAVAVHLVDEAVEVDEEHQAVVVVREAAHEVDEVVLEVVARCLSSRIDTPVSSSQRGRNTFWSQRTSPQESRSMARRGSASRMHRQKTQRQHQRPNRNTEYGIRSDPSLPLVSSVGWTTFTFSQAQRFSTSVLRAELVCHTWQTSWARKESSTPLNSLTDRVEI